MQCHPCVPVSHVTKIVMKHAGWYLQSLQIQKEACCNAEAEVNKLLQACNTMFCNLHGT